MSLNTSAAEGENTAFRDVVLSEMLPVSWSLVTKITIYYQLINRPLNQQGEGTMYSQTGGEKAVHVMEMILKLRIHTRT
jgi:hypothetical protein